MSQERCCHSEVSITAPGSTVAAVLGFQISLLYFKDGICKRKRLLEHTGNELMAIAAYTAGCLVTGRCSSTEDSKKGCPGSTAKTSLSCWCDISVWCWCTLSLRVLQTISGWLCGATPGCYKGLIKSACTWINWKAFCFDKYLLWQKGWECRNLIKRISSELASAVVLSTFEQVYYFLARLLRFAF